MNRLGQVAKALAEVGASLRQDGWKATLSGIGGRRDKGRAVRFCPSVYLDRETLAGLYRDSWLVRRIVTAVPEEALRRGFGEELDADELPEFERLNFARHPGEGALIRACNLARLMGGAGIYLGYRDGGADLTQPAREGAEVSFLEVFHRYELMPDEASRINDPADPEYGRPQIWQVVGQNRTGLRFHASRMIVFPGQPRADNQEVAAGSDRDWEDSVLQSMWEDVARYGIFWQSVSHLMQISSVGVLKIAGLIEMLTSQNQADAEARIDLLNEALSITRLMMLDASKQEEYHREAVSFTDVPALLQELQLATAGAVEMPVSVLFGRAPAGLNATGESDLRLWYDTVDVWRQRVLTPRAERLIQLCERKPDLKIEWPPLWEPTEKECAEVKLLETQRQHVLWQDGVLSEDEWRLALNESKPVEELMVGAPPEPKEPPPGAPQPDGEDAELQGLFADAEDSLREDAAPDIDAVQQRFAARYLKELEADPDVLADVSQERGGIKRYLVERFKDALPAKDEVPREKRARLKELKKAEAFKAAITDKLPALQKLGDEYAAENDRRSNQLTDDPEYRRPLTREQHAENAQRKREGRALIEGPRGGRYYTSVGGSRVYVSND